MPSREVKPLAIYTNYLIYKSQITLSGECKLLQDTESESSHSSIVQPGTTININSYNTNGCSNASYVLLYKNQNNEELERLYEQKSHRVETPPIYLNTSGIYCVHKHCETEQIGQCCTKVTGKDVDFCMHVNTYFLIL